MNARQEQHWSQRPITALAGLLPLILLCHENTLRADDHTAADSAVYNGNVAYFAGDYTSAEKLFYNAITNEPGWAIPYNNRGLARFHQGNFAGADADFDLAKGKDTNSVSPYVNKSKSLAAQKRFDDAITELLAGRELDTNRAAIYFNLGWVYDEKGLFPEALTNFSTALLINPNHYAAKLGRGVTYAKQGSVSNAIAHFYAVINDAPSGDMLAAIAAYDLQLLRGPGLSFNTDAGATNFIKGLFSYSTEQYNAAITNLFLAQTSEPALADIPWMTAWSYMGELDTNRADAALAQAHALMEPISVRTIGNPADVFIDGIKRGTSTTTAHLFRNPTTAHTFPNGYDISLRRVAGIQNQEWLGVTYSDGTLGGSNVMLLNPVTVTNFTRFGPVTDTDRDWLADNWETHWFGTLTNGPQGDETDHDGVSNLQEFWASTDPTHADTDSDGFSDFTEISILATDPVVPNLFYYVNDGLTNSDEWCTAPGNDSNNGLSPATPKATVQAIVDNYALKSGDVVLIDTGTYSLTNNISVTAADGGSSAAPVTFMASPYGVTINRGNMAAGNYVWDLNGANYVTLTTGTGTRHPELAQNWMKAVQAYNGICIQNATGCRVSRCDAYSNFYSGIYIGSCTAVTVENCVARGCTDPESGNGIRVPGGSGISVKNCTIYGNTKFGLSFGSSSGYTAINNLICADGSGSIAFWLYDSSASQCDYNDLWASNGASVGYIYNGAYYAALAGWRVATGTDSHSLNRDPLFVDPANGDFHLQSTAGSYHGGVWVADPTNSPCIDAGQPTSTASDEPAPNGNRVNLGAFGNTAQASKTPTDRMLVLVSPAGTELWRGVNSIIWLATGQGWGSNDTIRLEYSANRGANWTPLAGATALPYSAGSFAWDTTTVPSSPACLVRVSYNGVPAVQDVNQAVFMIHNTGIGYYVNDSLRTNDVYCTNIGNNANDGLSPATPKATVQAIIDAYALKPTDMILVDAGLYNLTNNITLTAADSGAGTNYVRIVGARHPVTGALTTLINRNSRASGAACFRIESGDGFSLEQMQLSGSADGVYLAWHDGSHRLTGLELCDNSGWGVSAPEGRYVYLLVDHCLMWNNGGGVNHYGGYGPSLTVRSCTIVQDRGAGIYWAYSPVVLSNNIVVASGAGSRCLGYDQNGPGSVVSDYNDFYSTWSATLSGWQADLFTWRLARGQDAHSFSLDPLFLDEWGGDFHLQSTGGSWHWGTWLADSTDSPCIDAGDPAALPAEEPSPNGGRLNLGAYGGTAQASASPAGQLVFVLSPVGGETWRGTNSIIWLATGQGWGSNDTVRLEYSTSHGASWTAIAGASALAYSAGTFSWDTMTVPSGAGYLVRVTCNRVPAALGTSAGAFTIHNGGLVYYVNDSSRANDVYCTATGNDANDGLSPGTPKARVQAILDAYDLEPGDELLVDAGVYRLTANITLTAADSGAGTNYVRIVGARHSVTGALTTLINRNSRVGGAACFRIESGDGFSLEQMQVSGGADGIYLAAHDGSHRLTGLEAFDNSGWGVNAPEGRYLYLLVDHCLLWDNGGGVNHYGGYGPSLTVRSCTIVQDGGVGINWAYSPVVLSNNIVVASGAGSRCLSYDQNGPGSVASDYNNLYPVWGATLSGLQADLVAWRAARGQDAHSFSLDPLFLDEWSGDYHLQSTAGSWHDGVWVPDLSDSPCIDAGDPTAAVLHEPIPNGNRLNLGVYGNTPQASKASSSQNLVLLSPLGGETWRGSNNIIWLATGQDWRSTNTVRLEYSTNHGAGWIAIAGASGLPHSGGVFSWNTLTVPSGAGYLVRVTCNEVDAVQDLSGSVFTIHNGGLVYYVNDNSRTNDVYCSAVGNDANDGLNPGTPKMSVQAMLDTYDLEPGDLLLVDAGVYNLTNNITLRVADSGAGTNYVRIVGARHSVTGALTTWFNRNSRASGAACFRIESGDGFSLEQMRLSGSSDGVYLAAHDGSHRLTGLELFDNNGWGVNAPEGRYLYLLVDHCLFWNNGGGVNHYGGYGPSLTVRSCTIVQDRGVGIYWAYSPVVLVNNLVVASGVGTRCLDWGAWGSIASDYNDFFLQLGAQLSGSYGNMAAWRAATGKDAHSLSLDPLFADEGSGDYHLQSTGGSWHQGTWVADPTNSPCIDTGDPTSDYSQESYWNGANINLGAHGNTSQASKSVDSDHDGLSNTLEIYRYGTNPNNPDTDGDGASDGQEIAQRTDPNNAASWATFITGAVSYAGSETGAVYVTASPGSFTNRVLSVSGTGYVRRDAARLPTGHVCTVTAWVYPRGYAEATYNGVVSWGGRSCSHDAFLLSLQNNGRPSMATFCNDFVPADGPAVTLNAWNHLAAVLDGQSVSLFVNGQKVTGTLPHLPNIQSGNLAIGCVDYPGRNFNGMIDEVSVWDRALNDGEILANMSRRLSGAESGLVGCWNFDDGTANDLSAYANDGVLMNDAVVMEASIPNFSAYTVSVPAPGSYCISNVPNVGPFTVSAFRDQNGNGVREYWEPQGTFAQNPVAVTSAGVSNVDLSLRGYEFETVYQTDFESGADAHWSSSLRSSNEVFSSFLGRFGNDAVTLTISNLPPHDTVRLGFDFYCIDSWDGGSSDYFGMSGDLTRSWSFGGTTQTYPGIPDAIGQFGFSSYQDAIYRALRDNNLGHGFVLPHTNSTLTISFYGQNLQDLNDESWGIDNVQVGVAFRDSDADGLPDSWELHYFGSTTGADPAADSDADGRTNLQEFQLGKNPLVFDNLRLGAPQLLPDGRAQVPVYGEVGRNYALETSTDLVQWVPLFSFACTNRVVVLLDASATNVSRRFYRLAPLSGVTMQLFPGSGRALTTNGMELSLVAPVGLYFGVSASTDLVHWVVFTNVLTTNAVTPFLDGAAVNYKSRFYRAWLP